MTARQWVDFDVELPAGASVEVDVVDPGNLRVEIECHNDPTTLTVLADALRAAVVEVDEQRSRAMSGTAVARTDVGDSRPPPSKRDPRRER